MPKKIQDIKTSGDHKINLKAESLYKSKSAEILRLDKNKFYKTSEFQDFSDIKNPRPGAFNYVRGKRFSPPRYLGNLVKIFLMGFALIIFINGLRVYYQAKKLENSVYESAYSGYAQLLEGGKDATKIQFEEALKSFDEAEKNFDDASQTLWFINRDNSFYGNEKNTVQSANSVLEGGRHFAQAGAYFLEAVEIFNKIPVYFVSKNEQKEEGAKASDLPSITDTINEGLKKTDLAIKEINEAKTYLEKIDLNSLTPDLKLRADIAMKQLLNITEILENTRKHFPALLKLLGDRYPHRYLILLQNNNEIRPTGGFIGSYAIMDMNEGYIEKLEVHDVYDLEFYGYIEPPKDFVTFGSWRFRDSNYSPDFPTSAQKAKWFLEKEGGPGVDTVVAINQDLLADLLEITGPVQVGDFGKFTAENYNLLLSFIIEGKIWGAEDPKHILKIFIPEFKKAILKEENISKVGSKLYSEIQKKNIMAWSEDDDIEGLFDATGLSGKVHESLSEEDYLSVVNVSVGGTKSDQFVEETISHNTKIESDGAITDELTIKRRHLWNDDIYYHWKKILNQYGFDSMPDQIVDILGRGRNKVLTKIYVPDGSVLLNSTVKGVKTGFDKDLKKTYFFTETEIKAGETKEIKLSYKLPFYLSFTPIGKYSLYVEKQPGSRGSILNKTFKIDELLDEKDSFAEGESYGDLSYDRYFSILLEKE